MQRLYRPFPLVLSLFDRNGNAVLHVEAKADPRNWLPGDHQVIESIRIPSRLESGTSYTLAVALVRPDTKKPAIKLAIDAPEKDRRYLLSTFAVD